MINRTEYTYELIKEDRVVNELKWSMAGGGVRILTEITTDDGVDELMMKFIEDCKREERTILPLSVRGQAYFERNRGEADILKSLDILFFKEQWK